MKIDPDGIKFIAIFLAAAAVSLLLFPPLSIIFVVLAAATTLFFRQTVFGGEFPPAALVAPACGKIVDIRELDEPEFIRGRALRVSIFMSLLDEHINYAPLEAEVVRLWHRPGSFKRADLEEASAANESQWIGLSAAGRRILMRQIAGKVARRIVCRLKEGDRVAPAQKIGLIRFGSRVELYLPPEVRLEVAVGRKVKGGVTVLGNLG